MTDGGDIGPVMAAAARTMHADMTAEEMLQSVVDVAASSIPGFEWASVSLLERGGKQSTQAATDDLARDLDQLQYELGEGPCIDAMKEPRLVEVPRLRHDQRWPQYVPAAVERGVTAQLSIMLYLDDDHSTLGGLNVYSTRTEDISDEASAMAELFATQAAVALGSNRRRLNLSEGMHSRQMIGQAVGILMERYQMDEAAAFRYLVRTSTTGNVRLRDVAESIVEDLNARRGSAPHGGAEAGQGAHRQSG